MCTHKRWITNKYTGHRFFVPCGHCKACLQEKANRRAVRIRNNYDNDHLALFVTLTYDRFACPYVRLDDLRNKVDVLPLYRDYSTRCTCHGNKRTWKRVKLDESLNPDYSNLYFIGKDNELHLQKLPLLKHAGAKVGVVWYKDVQNFIKRLRINLQRKYDYNEKFKFYSSSEYGEHTQRPHFHLLLFIRPKDEKIFRDAIYKSWPYANLSKSPQSVQVSRDAANYVSSYVNCTVSVSKVLADNFKPKHSYSKAFGLAPAGFQLAKILEKIDSRDMSYNRAVKVDGVPTVLNFPVPKYVINRFFPIFKGYSRLTDSTLYDLLLHPQRYEDFICREKGYVTYFANKQYGVPIDISKDDVHKIVVRLDNAFAKYHALTGNDRDSYARHHIEVWKCFRSTCLRKFYEDDSVNVAYKYDNIHDFYEHFVRSDLQIKNAVRIDDPNEFPQNINQTVVYTRLFDLKDKTRKVSNIVLSDSHCFAQRDVGLY